MKLKALIVTLALVLTSVFIPTTAQAYEITGFDLNSQYVMFASLDSGEIMFESAADVRAYPASLTKIMTAIVVLENCDDVDKKLTVPQEAISSLIGTGSSIGGLKEGEQLSVRHLLQMLLISSAADAANTLAIHFGGGDYDKFVSMMNNKAKDLGMKSTNFANPHGLHDDNHYSTARDLYKMAIYAYDMPIMMDICENSAMLIPATNLSEQRKVITTNHMINNNYRCYYKYARGMKTGFTSKAGRCLISTASKNGYNYICVLMGAETTSNINDRNEFKDAKNVFEWAFDNFEHRQVINQDKLVTEIPLKFSWDKDFLQLYPEKNVYAVVPKGIEDESLTYDSVLGGEQANAPIDKGEVVGYARIICAGEEVGTVNLVSKEDVSLNFLMLFKQLIDELLDTLAFKIVLIAIGGMVIFLIGVNVKYKKNKRTRARKISKIKRM